MAELLKESSCPEAAWGLEQHYRINRQEDHGDMIMALAKKLPLQDYDQALLGLRLTELVVLLMQRFDEKLLHYAQQALGQHTVSGETKD